MTILASTAVKGRLLKMRFGELLARAGGLEASSQVTRVGKSTLARYSSLSSADAECFAPVDVVADLESLTGEPLLTQTLCTMADGAFVALPSAPATRADLLKLLAEQAKEQSDVTTAVCAALGDGKITADEARVAVAEQDDLINRAVALRALLMSLVEDDR